MQVVCDDDQRSPSYRCRPAALEPLFLAQQACGHRKFARQTGRSPGRGPQAKAAKPLQLDCSSCGENIGYLSVGDFLKQSAEGADSLDSCARPLDAN